VRREAAAVLWERREAALAPAPVVVETPVSIPLVVRPDPAEEDEDAAPVVPNKKKPRDSVSGGCVTDQQLSLAPLHCYATREPNLIAGTTRTGKKVRLDVTVEDFQCGFVLLDYAHLHAKADHALPFNFFARLWEKLYGMGHFPRQFNARRWKVVRQTIWNRGYADIYDTDYWHHPTDITKSKCMNWGLKPQYTLLVLASGTDPTKEEAIIRRAAFSMPKGCAGLYWPNQLPAPGYDPSGAPIGSVTDYYGRKVKAFFRSPELWMEHFG
jgi:hypothetical protein